jgi:hypothetical protein
MKTEKKQFILTYTDFLRFMQLLWEKLLYGKTSIYSVNGSVNIFSGGVSTVIFLFSNLESDPIRISSPKTGASIS